MRYRKLDVNDDMTFGQGGLNFYVNSPITVGQAIKTRLLLFLGEWFLDTSDGTDWNTRVLGKYTAFARDAVIRDRVSGTPNVISIDQYQSQYDGITRGFTVAMTVTTAYGKLSIGIAGGGPAAKFFTIGLSAIDGPDQIA